MTGVAPSLPNAIAGLRSRLTLPVIAAPMFLVSGPDLVLAQCRAGIVGSFPALNARSSEELDRWLERIDLGVRQHGAETTFAVNLITHQSNSRLAQDFAVCVKRRVPLIISSLGIRPDIVAAVHEYGGLVFHDVVNVKHARKAAEAGVDGLVAVAAGAGGHAGALSPFALMQEIRQWWRGGVALAGAIATGRAIVAATTLGAEFAYIGSAFIATVESSASDEYKQMIIDCYANDIVYTKHYSGVLANFLRPSIVRMGIDPDTGESAVGSISRSSEPPRPWRDIWSSGQGIGVIDAISTTEAVVGKLRSEYECARQRHYG